MLSYLVQVPHVPFFANLEIDQLNKISVYAELGEILQRRKTARSPLIFGVRSCPDMHMKAEMPNFYAM